ncbi:hypothetical protein [Thauera sinica]|uniref:Uncharacterized protein n=1 Tax=Thauera sinica TaxID=2665146 RepID=A0ABW1AU53_9RHOO|nr:hypothetical protein [Thauera sp. K11]
MFRILGQISIYGRKASVDRCALAAPIPGSTITQIGLMRKIPDVDSWCYASPWYRFHLDLIDAEVRDFIAAHAQLAGAFSACDTGIDYAFFTLCPVEQSDEECFACVLDRETLQALSGLGVGLQIAPALVMPDVPYWVGEKVPGSD